MMRLSRELEPEVFETLLEDYQRLVQDLLASMGGEGAIVDDDTVTAEFPTAKHAVLAAVAAHRAVAAHEWPHGKALAMSVGLDSGGQALARCGELCDAAEGGQVFMTHAVSELLDGEDLSIRDLGEVPLRRSDGTVRAYELAS
jgi:class 3 adenylate cyclase